MSAGCSLDDAFPDGIQKPPKIDRGEKKKRKGPALSFLKGVGSDPDPDRPFAVPMEEGFANEKETLANQKEKQKEGFTNQDDPTVDVIGKGPPTDSYGHALSSYFGKSDTDDSLSQFSPSVKDTTGYTLNVEFPIPPKGTVSSMGLTANINDTWKPTTSYPNRGGVETAFFKDTPRDQGSDSDISDLKQQQAQLIRQIDMLFSRLEQMEHRRGEFAHTELALFILTGLFIMFGMDTVRKFK
uniref:Uncharacterized protein n=1 Tax=viral metagenome TaxID=1070528 RepID=A0A6C0L7T4_9ZZZZ